MTVKQVRDLIIRAVPWYDEALPDYAALDAVIEEHLDRPRWRWLASTVDLQRDYFNHVADPSDPLKTATSLRDNVLAALVELAGEAVREFAWKPWAKDDPWYRRDRILEEIVDAQHFMANMLVAIGVTDEEYEAAYQAKQEENRERQRRGYRVQHKLIEDPDLLPRSFDC